MSEKAPLRCASISKAISSVALGMLVEDGTIDIDTPISEYISDFPQENEKDQITVRHLASHTSGIRHYKGFIWNFMMI